MHDLNNIGGNNDTKHQNTNNDDEDVYRTDSRIDGDGNSSVDMIYSITHGYKIPVHNKDDKNIYTRMLSNINNDINDNKKNYNTNSDNTYVIKHDLNDVDICGDEVDNNDDGKIIKHQSLLTLLSYTLHDTVTTNKSIHNIDTMTTINATTRNHHNDNYDSAIIYDNTTTTTTNTSTANIIKNKRQLQLFNNYILRHHLQWRPIRAINDIYKNDIIISEVEPDRVVLSDDIKLFLFKMKRIDNDIVRSRWDVGSSNSNNNSTVSNRKGYSDVNKMMNQRLVIRLLESMGIYLHHNQCSHSQSQRLRSNYDSDEINTYCDQQVYEIMMTSSCGAGRSSSSNSTTTNNNNNYNNSASTILSSDLYQSLLMKSNDEVCMFSQKLLTSHIISIRGKVNSELDFIIHLLYDIILNNNRSKDRSIYSGDGSSNCGDGISSGSNDSAQCLSEGFKTELQCLLMHLLSVKYKLDMHTLLLSFRHSNNAGGNDSGSRSSKSGNKSSDDSSNDHKVVIKKMTQHLQWRCRQLIEQTIPKYNDSSNNSNSNSNNSPKIGNLFLWSRYIEIELMTGNFFDAMKVSSFLVYRMVLLIFIVTYIILLTFSYCHLHMITMIVL